MAPAGGDALDPMTATVLDGLVPLHIARLADLSEQDILLLAQRSADVIAEAGDRLTAPGNFLDPDDCRIRGRLLNAMAAALALGARQDGGITWCGYHWCTRPHPGCPRRQSCPRRSRDRRP